MITIHPLAVQLIRCLPAALPTPEVSVEDDGNIDLDWMGSQKRAVSVSLCTSGRLAYAWTNDVSNGHGLADFDGVNFPPVLSDLIRNHIAEVGNMVGTSQPLNGARDDQLSSNTL